MKYIFLTLLLLSACESKEEFESACKARAEKTTRDRLEMENLVKPHRSSSAV